MIKPTLDEAKELAREYSLVPLALEIFSDQKTPIEILRNLSRKSEYCFILESVNGSDSWGRYSFLGYKPVLNIYGTKDSVTVDYGVSKTEKKQDAVLAIKELISKHKSPRISYLPPFTGGFVGYFAYDFVQHFIPGLTLCEKNENNFYDFHLMLIDKVIVFDHFKQKIYIIVNISTEDIENSYTNGAAELKNIENMLLEPLAHSGEETPVCGEFSQYFSEEAFKAMIGTVKSHIAEGDIFQAVISNRFSAPYSGSLINTYRILRTINPSPYMVYMRLHDMEIACSSPETLVALRNGRVNSFPLAGTCPRSETSEEDAVLIDALLKDEKELAEHNMLVDLARNDLGKISRFDSVKLCEYRQVKKFSHVCHISSHITGELKESLDALDVIAATLPAGTLSGAPKKRACEIINEVEGMKRGVYGGSIGYIDFAGNADMCIGIRMAVLKDGNVYVQSGAGIVADSVPEREYRETQNKAGAIIEALKKSGEV